MDLSECQIYDCIDLSQRVSVRPVHSLGNGILYLPVINTNPAFQPIHVFLGSENLVVIRETSKNMR